MPLRDGTGPYNGPPLTGRFRGTCGTKESRGLNLPGGRSVGSEVINRIVLPLVGVIVADLVRPNSAIRQITGRVVKRLTGTRTTYLPMNEQQLDSHEE